MLQQQMKNRHLQVSFRLERILSASLADLACSLQMIAVGGSIGTGLFIGSGGALRRGGPAALVIDWTIMGEFLQQPACHGNETDM